MEREDAVRYRLGLDVGTNSLGWAVLELDGEGVPCAILAAGSRIFSDGREPKSKSTLAADRRQARQMRRRRDRFLQRQTYLMDQMRKMGLFPTRDSQEAREMQKIDPVELRGRLLTESAQTVLADIRSRRNRLGRPLLAPGISEGLKPQYLIGRALFHLNQRRGFKSNRKDRSDEVTSGKVHGSIRELLKQMGLPQDRIDAIKSLKERTDLTYGSFLWNRRRKGGTTRARMGEDGKLYEIYPQRDLYEDEFEKLWTARSGEFPEILTPSHRERIHEVIFTQRPLKAQERGRCVYCPNENRTYRALPSFQRYRILQEVNNLSWSTSKGIDDFLRCHIDIRDRIISDLEEKKSLPFEKMKNYLKEAEIVDENIIFNFESERRKGFDGNMTSFEMRKDKCVGSLWDQWDLDRQDAFIDAIFGQVPDEKRPGEDREQTDEEVLERLVSDFGLDPEKAENCLNARLDDGTASISPKAARLLFEKMKNEHLHQPDAVETLSAERDDFENPYTRAGRGELIGHLPYYGKVFEDGRHIIPGKRNPEDEGNDLQYYGGITNPTVHIALNQIRIVINELIRRFGLPHSIAIELGRDLPQGARYRSGFERLQSDNQNKNREIDEELGKLGQYPNRDNRLRLQLWRDQKECCPYTGEMIGVSDLFTDRVQVDHILPFSRTLDDSRANKVVCFQRANAFKANKTPWEAFSESPQDYHWESIVERARSTTYQSKRYNSRKKRWEDMAQSQGRKFQKDAMERYERDGGFLERHINDTRYIGRIAKEYLENICDFRKIDVVTGALTALLRKYWGLNSILDNKDNDDLPKKKNRDDHRHHAIDAIVVGMTSRSMLQRVSTATNLGGEIESDKLLIRSIDPWEKFRTDVRKVVKVINVSHRPTHKGSGKTGARVTTDGRLHNDTAYGIVGELDDDRVVLRRNISQITDPKKIESIRDNYLRSVFHQAYIDGKAEGVSNKAKELGIRTIRCIESLRVIPIYDASGKVYKGYKGDSNWGLEVYEYPAGHKNDGKWEGIVITRFEANGSGFQPGVTRRPHPAARLVMRLRANDCIEIEKNHTTQTFRIQKISKNGINIAPLSEANVDARNRSSEDFFKFTFAGLGTLKKIKARKVHVSPTGLTNYEKR